MRGAAPKDSQITQDILFPRNPKAFSMFVRLWGSTNKGNVAIDSPYTFFIALFWPVAKVDIYTR